VENLISFRAETLSLTSNKNTIGNFELIMCGNIRLISFTNIYIKNDYETIFVMPDWFCKDSKLIYGSCTNGTGGAGGEVAEIHFDAPNKKLKFYPNIHSGFSSDLQLTGQIMSVAL